MASDASLQVAVIMGSASDWETMRHASETLKIFGISHECRVLSAHRTPDELNAFIESAEERGCGVFIAGAGGAAHLPGVIAAKTLQPVLGVPIETNLQGLDSLLSIVQMPSGIPVGTLGIGKAGAVNAALLSVAILGIRGDDLHEKLRQYRRQRAEGILGEELP
jgi:5-(carboxyamino)imidazole ribonucleotide mutase